jgi:DNA-binding NtrC family response regulator
MTPPIRVLIVDDEHNIRDGIAAAIREDGREVRTARNGADALAAITSSGGCDVVITDLKMPGSVDGLKLVRKVRAAAPGASVIIITAYGTVETAVGAMKLGAFDYISKPLDLDHLRTVARNAVEKQELIRENLLLKKRLAREQKIIAGSPLMKKVMEMVGQVAASDVTVFITGESGTGKEMIARAIHNNSFRQDKPFVAAHCSSMPESLFESEMFGHERGAFTGALRRHIGRFELARGGTLFLDEVADMPPQYQVDLLRVLQERELRRVGGEEIVKIDVRIISATNRNLAEAVAHGTFRQDLYYRLNVVPVELPPLRKRHGDVPLLIEEILREFNAVHGKDIRLSEKTQKLLARHRWPGNVRELRNLLERLVVTSDSSAVSDDSLPDEIRFPEQRQHFGLDSVVSRAERKAIIAALEQTADNRQCAADLLGVSVRTLHYKLKKLGMT